MSTNSIKVWPIGLNILYEDKHLLILTKYAGLAVSPLQITTSASTSTQTTVTSLVHKYLNTKSSKIKEKAYPLNLATNTIYTDISGIITYTKTIGIKSKKKYQYRIS